jgi:hypothetical protein
MSSLDDLFVLTACVDLPPLYPGFKGCYVKPPDNGTLSSNYAALTAVEISECCRSSYDSHKFTSLQLSLVS